MKLQVRDGKEYSLGGRRYQGGQVVEVPDRYVRILTAPRGPLQLIKSNPTDLPGATGNKPAKNITENITAPAAAAPAAPAAEPDKKKGRHNRRDMRAES